jgi:tRNA (cytidine/uridine-2'-O-)-methyltransferase
MLHLALYQPEIPPNTGNLIRLCANTGTTLHLIGPLGFSMSDKDLRRAGLDYHEYADVRTHDSLDALVAALSKARLLAFSTRAERRYDEAKYRVGDILLFGPETRGLPQEVFMRIPAERRLRLPMQPGSRSLNLANAASIAVYEAWRQLGFKGAAGS